MYCGKNRMALASQEQIARAILTLIEEKPYASISVSELCKLADISRQTFYSLFESKDNVMVFILQDRYCYVPAVEGEHLSCLEQLCRSCCHYIVEQRAFIRMLEENHITYLLHDSFREALSGCSCYLDYLPKIVRPYVLNYVAGAFTSIAQTYVCEEPDFVRGCKAGAEKKTASGPARQGEMKASEEGREDEEFLYKICLELLRGGLLREDENLYHCDR